MADRFTIAHNPEFAYSPWLVVDGDTGFHMRASSRSNWAHDVARNLNRPDSDYTTQDYDWFNEFGELMVHAVEEDWDEDDDWDED